MIGHRGPWLLVVALLLACAPAASAQSDAAGAWRIAYQTASAGARNCRASVDPSFVYAYPTGTSQVTAFRPAGYDVRVRFNSRRYSNTDSRWLVSGGVAYPQDITAARLAAGCNDRASVAPQAPLDWHRLQYLDPSTGQIEIGSSPAWSGAYFIRPLLRYSLSLDPSEETRAAVWAARCSPGRQVVRFTRTVYLLGPPAELRFGHVSFSRGLRVWPFLRVTLYLNGQAIYRRSRAGDGSVSFPQTVLHSVLFGSNRFDVVVVKRKTGTCNTTRTRRKIGIAITLGGRHAWSLAATRPPAQTQQTTSQQLAANGGDVSALFRVPYTLVNNGPSTLLEPVFVVRTIFRAASVQAFGPVIEGAGGTCGGGENLAANVTDRLTACGLAPMPPGSARVLNVSAGGVPDPKPDAYLTTWQTSWDFNGVTGLAPQSLCVPPKDMPDCSTLRPAR